jgi:NADH dehydrogenase [ubiquinone] 1 alpha subcomplex assembly factor 5
MTIGKDIKRTYTSILDVGSGPGHFSKLLDPHITEKVVMLDFSGEYSLS